MVGAGGVTVTFVGSSYPLSFTVLGEPAPAGSKRAFMNKHTGRISVTDASKRSKPWQAEVKSAAIEAIDAVPLDGLLTGPLTVEFTFFKPRPKNHYGSGKNSGVLKLSAPEFPTTRPDALKLARAVEDALSGVVYRDDAQIVTETLRKRYGSPARCEVSIRPVVREFEPAAQEAA
jgi:Holliday junction resolvase RusA-like endonuclease